MKQKIIFIILILICLLTIGIYFIIARDQILFYLPRGTLNYLYFNNLPLTASGYYTRQLSQSTELAAAVNHFWPAELRRYQKDFLELIARNKNQLLLAEVKVEEEIQPLVITTTSCSQLNLATDSQLTQWPKITIKKNICLLSPQPQILTSIDSPLALSFQNFFSGLRSWARRFSVVAVYHQGSEVLPDLFSHPLKQKISLAFKLRPKKATWQLLIDQDIPALSFNNLFQVRQPNKDKDTINEDYTWLLSIPDFEPSSLMLKDSIFIPNQPAQKIFQTLQVMTPELFDLLKHKRLQLSYALRDNSYLLLIYNLTNDQLSILKDNLLQLAAFYYPQTENQELPDKTQVIEYKANANSIHFTQAGDQEIEILSLSPESNYYLLSHENLLAISDNKESVIKASYQWLEDEAMIGPVNLKIDLSALNYDLPYKSVYLEQQGQGIYYGIFNK